MLNCHEVTNSKYAFSTNNLFSKKHNAHITFGRNLFSICTSSRQLEIRRVRTVKRTITVIRTMNKSQNCDKNNEQDYKSENCDRNNEQDSEL